MRRGLRLTGIKYVTKPDGRRYVYRRTPGGLVRLPDLPENDPRFLAAYVAAETARKPVRAGAGKGSISALCAAYIGSPGFKRLAPSTRRVRALVVDKIATQRGKGKVADLEPRHLRKDLHERTPGAAANRLKAWRALCAFALDAGWIDIDPSRDVRAPSGQVTPHRQWDVHEIETYRAHWPPGSPERAAMEVIYWTASACVDAVRLGEQMVDRDGWLTFRRQKTGELATVPVRVLPPWADTMEPDHRHFLAAIEGTDLLWVTTRTGCGRSVKGLSQMIARTAREAGLSGCTAHGLRKARAAAVAEARGTPSQIGAWLGDVSLGMVAHYTRQADRKAVLGAEQEQNSGNRTGKVSKLPRNP